MTEHTKGPWRQDAVYGCKVFAGERWICDTWYQRETAAERDEDLANARAITALFDLLVIAEWIDDWPRTNMPDPQRKALRDAIAKAKGETDA